MQYINLSDDELLRAIAANTEAMSKLCDQQRELGVEISSLSDPTRRSELMHSYVDTVDKCESEYRTYTAELRRRHPS